MKKILLITSFCFLSWGALMAQNNTSVSYSVGFGTGDVGSFISKPSFRGISLDYRRMINPNVGVGFSVGWNVFYQEMATATYSLDTQSLTGKQYRYSNHVPMYINPTYFFKPGAEFNPFLTLGIGTIYTRRNTDMNMYTIEQEAWNFGMAPEAGFQYALNDVTAVTVSGRFNYGFKAGNELNSAQSFFSLNIGLAFMGGR